MCQIKKKNSIELQWCSKYKTIQIDILKILLIFFLFISLSLFLPCFLYLASRSDDGGFVISTDLDDCVALLLTNLMSWKHPLLTIFFLFFFLNFKSRFLGGVSWRHWFWWCCGVWWFSELSCGIGFAGLLGGFLHIWFFFDLQIWILHVSCGDWVVLDVGFCWFLQICGFLHGHRPIAILLLRELLISMIGLFIYLFRLFGYFFFMFCNGFYLFILYIYLI